MYRVEANFDDLIASQNLMFDQLRDVDKVLRTAALNTVVLISDRIQQKGLKTDGNPIGGGKGYSTGKRVSGGRFNDIANKRQKKSSSTSEGGYKEFRKRLGRQTDHIDLTLTGDMMNDFIAEPEGQNEYSVGFRGDESSKKAEWNEQRFGTVFQLSDSEFELIKDIINKDISAITR